MSVAAVTRSPAAVTMPADDVQLILLALLQARAALHNSVPYNSVEAITRHATAKTAVDCAVSIVLEH